MSDLPAEVAPDGASRSAADERVAFRWLRRRRAAIALALVAVCGAAGVVTWRSRGERPAEASAAPDVPRIDGNRITFSPSFARRSRIEFADVRVRELVPVVAAVGTAELNAEHVAAVGARLRGLVSRVDKFEGDAVDVGTPLARIESAELGEAQAAVSMLDAERQTADLNAAREASLADRHLTTARELETASVEAKKAELLLAAAKQKVNALGGSLAPHGATLGAHDLVSPIRGTVVERSVAPGQFVAGDVVAFEVANLDHLWIELDVFERNLNRIRLGDRAELKLLSGGSTALSGRVAKIASKIDPETHSAKVRIEVENQDHLLRVGQAVKAEIHASGGLSAEPTVPTRAITFVDGKPTVFVAAGGGSVRIVNVREGASDGQDSEILDGVSAGDRVVTEGAFALKSELFR